MSYPTVKRWGLRDWRHRFIETICLSQNSSHEGSHTKDQKKIKGLLEENCRLKWTCRHS